MGLEARPFVGNAAAEPRAPVAEARLDTAERPSRVDAENRPEAIALMAELVEEHGKDGVAAAVEMVAGRSLRSPVRTPEYVRGILRNWRAASDEGPMMVREVPYLGYVAAGPPVLAEEQALGTIRARVPRAAAGPLFALRVSGDSMVGAGIEDGDYVIEDGDYVIEDGDYVIVAGRPVAENGDIVLALLNGESTVKRLVRRDGYIALQPENEKYRAMLVGPGDELVIQGKVVATTRSKRPPDSPPPL